MSADPYHGTSHSNSDQLHKQQQFLALFLRSEREIFRYVCALVPMVGDAEEIVQQTAMALWEKFDDYDSSLPFTPWACRFALNNTRQWLERHARWKMILENGLADAIVKRRENMLVAIDSRLKHLQGCVEKLPPSQKGLIEDYYFSQKEISQLSMESGRTEAATYKLLQRIRKSLQTCIENAARNEGLAV